MGQKSDFFTTLALSLRIFAHHCAIIAHQQKVAIGHP